MEEAVRSIDPAAAHPEEAPAPTSMKIPYERYQAIAEGIITYLRAGEERTEGMRTFLL